MRKISSLLLIVSLTIFLGCKKNGVDGKNALVDLIVEPAGENCSNGGFKVVSGMDLNNNNIIDSDEIQTTEYVCNGENGNNGLNSLIDMIPEPQGNNCSNGGFKILTGLDINYNGILDNDEIQKTDYLCNVDSLYNNHDNLLRLVVGRHGVSAYSTDWVISEYPTYNLPDFYKGDYNNVDSIIFVPSMHTNDPSTKCIVELFNITDGLTIENSLVESNMSGYNFHYSMDIYDFLPAKRIDLGVRIKSEHDDIGVTTGIVSYLYIYKH
jgi:hypothetical protein